MGKSTRSLENLPASSDPEAEEICRKYGLDPETTTLRRLAEFIVSWACRGDIELIRFLYEMGEEKKKMKREEILNALRSMGAKRIIDRGDNVYCSCPFARQHSKGTDNRPSFTIKVDPTGPSLWHCFSCGAKGRDLPDLIKAWRDFTGRPGPPPARKKNILDELPLKRRLILEVRWRAALMCLEIERDAELRKRVIMEEMEEVIKEILAKEEKNPPPPKSPALSSRPAPAQGEALETTFEGR